MEETIVENVIVNTIDNTHIMGQALQITLIGMVLLFISLLILWGVMELLVLIVKDPTKIEEDEGPSLAPATEVVDEEVLKMRAAAAAVASVQNYDLKMRAAAAAAGYVLSKQK